MTRAPHGGVLDPRADKHAPPAAGPLIRRGADLVHLTEELHVRLLSLTIVMLGASAFITIPVADANARERPGVLTDVFCTLALAASIAALGGRRPLYRWLRVSPVHRLAPAVAGALVVLADAPYSPSWWIAQALLFVLAAVGDTVLTLAGGVSVAAAYLGGTALRSAPLIPGGDTEYLTVALALVLDPLCARAICELFARFTLRLHQLECEVATAAFAPKPVHGLRTGPPAGSRSTSVEAQRPPRAPARALSAHGRPGATSRLTSRQLEVTLLIADGLRQGEVATALGISPRQVERHLEQARARAHAATTAHLVAMLARDHLTPSGTPAGQAEGS